MNEISNILISIIVPIYNVEKELSRCVDSILKQTYKNIQIILVNDGSKDNSPKICEEYKKKDLRVNVIHKNNGGLSDARNCGIDLAIGQYILFVDSDDYLELDSCERFINSLGKKRVDIVIGEAKKINGKNISFLKHTNLIEGRVYSSEEYIEQAIRNFEWYAPVWLNMYRREFLLENSLYFKKGILHEDMQILPKLFLKAKDVLYMNYCFYNYDIREGSITQSRIKSKNIDDLMNIYEEWKSTFNKIDNIKLKRLLYGILVKQYLFTCRKLNVIHIGLAKGINRRFLISYALNSRERLKAIIYSFSPKLYSNLNKNRENFSGE